jgi:hypothetical protein
MLNKIVKVSTHLLLDETNLQYDIWLLAKTYLVTDNIHGPIMEFRSYDEAETFVNSICEEG